MKICHLTSVHKRNDTRIFLKECVSCVDASLETVLIVSDGLGNGIEQGVRIVDIGKFFHLAQDSSRLQRMRKTLVKIYDAALIENADVYHFHDPELMFVGNWLKKKGKTVIYDAHEDLPKGIYSKPYIKSFLQPVVSRVVRWVENYLSKKFDAIVTATPSIAERFRGINKVVVNVNNFPILGELNSNTAWKDREQKICFLGVITAIRGVKEVIESLKYVPEVKFELAGLIYPDTLRDVFTSIPSWSNVTERGVIDRNASAQLLSSSKIGMVTFLPMRNHTDALPNKLFEYMSAGLPIIASNFDLWKGLVEDNNCGICVDPNDPKAIGDAIATMLADDDKLCQMGENGKKAVYEKYNWTNEQTKLIDLYKKLI